MRRERARVAVDLLFYTGKRGGTETYSKQLIPRVAALCPEVDFVAITNSTGRDAIAAWFPGPVETLRIGGDNRPVWALAEVLAVGPFARRLGADLLWCAANFGPGSGTVPRVVTVHDVIAFEQPNPQVSRVTQGVTSWIIRRAARSARHLLTVSDDAAESIVRTLGVDRDRITSTPLASSPPTPVDDYRAELESLGVPDDRPIVLSAGNRMPHKNFENLLRGLATIDPARRPRLVITGSHGPDPLRALVAELGLVDDVVLLGWVTAPQLESLFLAARMYAIPSLAEGFGLPVLDAMKRGRPVLASDIPVLREVGADAVMYVDTRDPQAIGSGIVELLGNDALAERLRSAGLERAAGFTWDRTAELASAVIRDAVTGAVRSRT